jgi:hypothetical protein
MIEWLKNWRIFNIFYEIKWYDIINKFYSTGIFTLFLEKMKYKK